MLDNRFKSLLRGLIYPVQFEEKPTDGVDRVLGQVVFAKAMNATPGEYLAAVEAGLQSNERLSGLIPQKTFGTGHPDVPRRNPEAVAESLIPISLQIQIY